MIPKTIHYFWFGKKDKPEIINSCISSWKKYMPDYQIKEWNEENYDIDKFLYTKEAYACKKWAFVSDLARIDILYEYGGIYLDVDVEFLKSLPEEYMLYDGFCGFEHTKNIAPGLIFGVEKNNQLIKEILDSYKNEHFYLNKKDIYKTINMRITDIFCKNGLVQNGDFQIVKGIRVFPSEYFCGYDTDVRETEITENTICIHHYLSSWTRKKIKTRLQDLLKKLIGVNNYRKILKLKREIKK